MTVVDASVVVAALTDDAGMGALTRRHMAGRSCHAPELLDLEVLSALRRMLRARMLTPSRAAAAVRDLTALPVPRAPHGPLIDRCWQLRDNVTAYDAAFVALAELLDVPLLTTDRKLAGASGLRCEVMLLSA